MFTLALVLIVLLAILLILIVLIQNSKGGLGPGMSTTSHQVIGVKNTTEVLEKVTWGLAVSIMVLCLATNFVLDRPSAGNADVSSANIERAQEAPATAPSATQQQPAADSSK